MAPPPQPPPSQSLPTLPASSIANSFVSQYFTVRHATPELLHRFYRDDSSVLWPASFSDAPPAPGAPPPALEAHAGQAAINTKALALELKALVSEVHSVDSTFSAGGGVIVLSFFLCPQEKGFYVLSDVLRLTAAAPGLMTPPQQQAAKPVAAAGAASPAEAHHVGGGTPESSAPSTPGTPPQHPTLAGFTSAASGPAVTPQPPSGGVAGGDAPGGWAGAQLATPAPVPGRAASAPMRSLGATGGGGGGGGHAPSAAAAPWTPAGYDAGGYAAAYAAAQAHAAEHARALAAAYGNPAAYAYYSGGGMMQHHLAAGGGHHMGGGGGGGGSGGTGVGGARVPRATLPPAPPPVDDSASIFVRRLPLDVTEADLVAEFSRFGPLRGGAAGISIKQSNSRCFAFIEFASPASAQAAQAARCTVAGKPVGVEEKRPMSTAPRPGRSGRGRGGGLGGGGYGGRGGMMGVPFGGMMEGGGGVMMSGEGGEGGAAAAPPPPPPPPLPEAHGESAAWPRPGAAAEA